LPSTGVALGTYDFIVNLPGAAGFGATATRPLLHCAPTRSFGLCALQSLDRNRSSLDLLDSSENHWPARASMPEQAKRKLSAPSGAPWRSPTATKRHYHDGDQSNEAQDSLKLDPALRFRLTRILPIAFIVIALVGPTLHSCFHISAEWRTRPVAHVRVQLFFPTMRSPERPPVSALTTRNLPILVSRQGREGCVT
jgi:hypothetical protein